MTNISTKMIKYIHNSTQHNTTQHNTSRILINVTNVSFLLNVVVAQ
jgi:hypothetical protein